MALTDDTGEGGGVKAGPSAIEGLTEYHSSFGWVASVLLTCNVIAAKSVRRERVGRYMQ